MEKRDCKRIYITHGAEYRAVEECIYEENLLFGEAYAQARDCLEEIIKISEQMQGSEQSAGSDFCAPYEQLGPDGRRRPENIVRRRSSNLIVFSAERGGGKTSAMISFVRALENLKRTPGKIEQKKEFWKGKKAIDYHYEVVPTIDPTSMEIDDSILKMVLVHMYANFQERVRAEGTAGVYVGSKEGERQELIRQFLVCFHFANRLNYKTKQPVPIDLEDELEYMEDKECGDNFRVQLYKLFEGYLRYMAPNGQSMLVISIDDADVNTARVYDLLEDVRKYLQMPKVVVMMAANMTQLESTVEQHFLKQYEASLKHNDSMVSVERCHSIAEFYLKKIIPSTRQLNLPSLSEELQSSEGNVAVIYRDKKEPEKNLIALPESEAENPPSGGIYQRQLLGLLHKKTGLIFVPPKGYLHDFLPTGMRELTHFLAFLCDMSDVEATYETIINQVMAPQEEQRKALLAWQKNLKHLQHYLVNIWSATNLRTSSKMILRELINQPEENKHEYLLRILPDYYGGERVAYNVLLGIATEEENIYSENFVSKCVEAGIYKEDSWKSRAETKTDATYADVMAALRILTNSQGGNRQYKLACAIRLYYTIYLHLLLLTDCCNKPPFYEDAYKTKTYGYCVTDFLRDGLFKCSPQGSIAANPAFWHLPLSGKKLKDAFLRAESAQLENRTPDVVARQDNLPKSRKITNPIHQSDRSLIPKWFRIWKPNERYGKSIWVDSTPIENHDTIVFHPFYPLFAEMDAFTSRASVREGAKKEYDPDGNGRRRLFLSMMILLNADVQQHILHAYKDKDVKLSKNSEIYPKGILTDPLESDVIEKLIDVVDGTNEGLNQEWQEGYSDIWETDKERKRYPVVLSVLPGLEKIYLAYLIQEIEKVTRDLLAIRFDEVTIGELEDARSNPEGSEARNHLYQKLSQDTANDLLANVKLPAISENLKTLLQELLSVNKDLFTEQDKEELDQLEKREVTINRPAGYGYLTTPIPQIMEFLDEYKVLLKRACDAIGISAAPKKQEETESSEERTVSLPQVPAPAQQKPSSYDTYRAIFRALFDELAAMEIHIEQVSPPSNESGEQS